MPLNYSNKQSDFDIIPKNMHPSTIPTLTNNVKLHDQIWSLLTSVILAWKFFSVSSSYSVQSYIIVFI